MKFRIALAQVSASEKKGENLERGVALIDAAADRGADLLVLPELFMMYAPLDELPATFAQAAEDIHGAFVTRLAGEAKKKKVHVAVGILERSRSKDKVHNTIVMLGPDGKVIATHRKLQLFDSFGYEESSRFESGADVDDVFKTKLGKFGLMTCYELRFP